MRTTVSAKMFGNVKKGFVAVSVVGFLDCYKTEIFFSCV